MTRKDDLALIVELRSIADRAQDGGNFRAIEVALALRLAADGLEQLCGSSGKPKPQPPRKRVGQGKP